MAPFNYVRITSAVLFNSCPTLFCSLLEPALMCLRAAQSWAPGETAWRRRSAKSCSTRLTRWSWTSGAFHRSCRAISWRCSSQSSRSCSAEGRTGLWICDGWPPYQNIWSKSPVCAKKKIKPISHHLYIFSPFYSCTLHQELFMHEMQVPVNCSGVAAVSDSSSTTQLWNYCFILGPSVHTAHFPLCSAGNWMSLYLNVKDSQVWSGP